MIVMSTDRLTGEGSSVRERLSVADLSSSPELFEILVEHAYRGVRVQFLLRAVLLIFMVSAIAAVPPAHDELACWLIVAGYALWSIGVAAWTRRGGVGPVRQMWIALLVDTLALTALTLVAGASSEQSWTADLLVNGFFLLPMLAATQLRPLVCAVVVLPATVAYFAASVATKAANTEPWGSILVRTFVLVGLSVGAVALSWVQLSRVRTIAALAGERRDLLDALLTLEARERSALAEQLHDGALQYVLAARQDLEEARIGGQASSFDRIELALTESSVLLRSTVSQLSPAVLAQAGLARALRDLAERNRRTGRSTRRGRRRRLAGGTPRVRRLAVLVRPRAADQRRQARTGHQRPRRTGVGGRAGPVVDHRRRRRAAHRSAGGAAGRRSHRAGVPAHPRVGGRRRVDADRCARWRHRGRDRPARRGRRVTVTRRTSQSFPLAALLALAAGSIEAYSVLHLDAFAGAQTGNVVFAAIAISRWQWSIALRYILPILAFIGGVLIARTLLTHRVAGIVRRPYRAILIVEVTLLVVMGFLPESTPRELLSVIITVAVAAQMSTFRTVVDVGYNSAFTTGNLMNALTAAHAGLVKKDQSELVHARRLFVVIACFVIGAVLGAVATREWGRHGVWFGAAVLGLALVLFITDERFERQEVVE